jgi:hypothetical protein
MSCDVELHPVLKTDLLSANKLKTTSDDDAVDDDDDNDDESLMSSTDEEERGSKSKLATRSHVCGFSEYLSHGKTDNVLRTLAKSLLDLDDLTYGVAGGNDVWSNMLTVLKYTVGRKGDKGKYTSRFPLTVLESMEISQRR